MEINAERNLLIEEIKQVDDIALLRAIKAILLYGRKHERHITIEQYNKELEQADHEIDLGSFVSHEDFKRDMKEW